MKEVCTCRNCTTEYVRGRNTHGIYCSNACQAEYQKALLVKDWLAGLEQGWTGKTRQLCDWLRAYLKLSRGSACSECSWDEKHPIDNKSLTEIDHIDGDAENCRPDNLRILCPNCHSKTPTFRNRNKKSKRER